MHTGSENNDDVLATIKASPGRRILGIGSLWVLALLVIYIAIVKPPDIGWQVFLFVLGGIAIWVAEQMRRSTAVMLILTRDALCDSSGAVLARTEEIISLDRGMFAFKPSNGFLLHLKQKRPRAWRPGLWWAMGSRIGVGGMTPAHQAKFMAEIIATMLAERNPE